MLVSLVVVSLDDSTLLVNLTIYYTFTRPPQSVSIQTRHLFIHVIYLFAAPTQENRFLVLGFRPVEGILGNYFLLVSVGECYDFGWWNLLGKERVEKESLPRIFFMCATSWTKSSHLEGKGFISSSISPQMMSDKCNNIKGYSLSFNKEVSRTNTQWMMGVLSHDLVLC